MNIVLCGPLPACHSRLLVSLAAVLPLTACSAVVTGIPPDRDGHAGKDDADNCPFRKRKAANARRAGSGP